MPFGCRWPDPFVAPEPRGAPDGSTPPFRQNGYMARRLDLRRAAMAQADVMVDRLAELVEMESSSDDPAALHRCADLLDGWFAPILGSPALRPIPELPHLLWRGTNPQVLLLGHFDTVWPVGTLASWPFATHDGIGYGPGIFDMKAGIIQMLTAVDQIADAASVSLLLTCDEETGSATSRAMIEAEALRAGLVLVCEPSADGGSVKTARKGISGYEIHVAGRAAHAGLEPELGVNASIEIAHQILALGSLARVQEGSSVTPTVLTGGTSANSVPESARVVVDVRAWTRTELDRIHAAMMALEPCLPGARLTIEGGVNRYPLEPELNDELLAMAQLAAEDVGEDRPEGVRSGGGSDGNLTAAVGVPTLDGLGAVGAHPHARTERVNLAAMPGRAAMLAALIGRITS